MADTKAIIDGQFNYHLIDKDLGGKLKRCAQGISKGWASFRASVMEIGEWYCTAHAELAQAGCEGRFSAWVESETPFSRSTAYNYIRIYERFGALNCPTVGQFNQSALMLLAKEDTPKKAISQAAKIAERGGRIDRSKATELIEKYGSGKQSPGEAEDDGEDDDDIVEEGEVGPVDQIKRLWCQLTAKQQADVRDFILGGGTTAEIPDALQTDEFIDAWQEWLVHYRQRTSRHMRTPQMAKTLSRLKEMGLNRAIAAIEHSIGKGWQSINEKREARADRLQQTIDDFVENG